MKKLIAMAAAIVFALGANAQIGKGEVVLGASVGVGNTVYSGDNYTSKLIPLNLDVEVGVAENLFDVESLSLGVGALASYTQAKVDWSLGDVKAGWRNSATILGAKGALHYNLGVEKLDTYVSLSLGYTIASGKAYGKAGDNKGSSDSYANENASGFYYGISLGARYWFTDFLGVNLEAGYGLSFLKAGLSFRF